MERKEEILKLAHEYTERCPEQKEEAEPLILFLNGHAWPALIDRKNFTGHITTSAFIIDKSAKALLLLKHKSLNRWLQPGGHVDVTDASLIASAAREASEETGLLSTLLTLFQIPFLISTATPFLKIHENRNRLTCTMIFDFCSSALMSKQ